MTFNIQTVVAIILEVIAFILSVIGNSVVIYVMTREKKLKRKSNIYILSVAVADFLVGIVAIPIGIMNAIDNRPHDFNQCVYLTSFAIGFYASSILSLIAVSFDRYRAICHPISYRVSPGTYSTKLTIVFCWIGGMSFGSLPALGLTSDEFHGKCFATTVLEFNYLFVCCIFSCFGSASVMIVVYGLIYRSVAKHEKTRLLMRIHKCSSQEVEESSIKTREVRVANTFALIISSFILCWTPKTLICLTAAITRNRSLIEDNEIMRNCYVFAVCAAHYNSAIDPIIYTYRIKEVRAAIKKILRCSFSEVGNGLESTSNSHS